MGQAGSARFSFNRSGPGLQPDTTARTSPQRTVKGSRPDLQHEMRPTVGGCSPSWSFESNVVCVIARYRALFKLNVQVSRRQASRYRGNGTILVAKESPAWL